MTKKINCGDEIKKIKEDELKKSSGSLFKNENNTN